MTVKHEIKSQLAKLLATEDLIVEHKKVKTATFNVHTRVLILPKWDRASNNVYDTLVAHEVGHALYTPDIDWSKDLKVPPSFVNIVEDVRIEKLMKRRYDGLAKCFYKGYNELNDDDFFDINDQDLTSFNIADRVNLYFKVGAWNDISFSDNETPIVDLIANVETFDDTLSAAEALYNLCKQELENQKEEINLDEDDISDGEDTRLGNSSINSDGDDTNSDDSDNSDMEDDVDPDYQPFSSGGNIGVDHKIEIEPEIQTADALENAIKHLTNTSNNLENTYFELPKLDLKKIIINNKTIHDNIEKSWKDDQERWNTYYKENNLKFSNKNLFEEADCEYMKFKRSAQKEVNYLVKEFECKKAASAYARSSTARTGVLDTAKLHTYKFNEDLFKKVTVIPDGKNHGLVFILDWSGSMQHILHDTVKQLFNLLWFCNKVNIPFEVYAFTCEYPHAGGDRLTLAYEKKEGLAVVEETFSLMNLFTSKVKTKELENQMKTIFRLSCLFDRSMSLSYNVPFGMRLSGTPLNESLIALHQIIPQFKSEYNIEKVQCVILTDGEGSPLKYTREYKKNDYEDSSWMGSNYIGDRCILRNRKTGYTYSCDGLGRWADVTNLLLKDLRETFIDVNFIGIRILGGRDASHFIKSYIEEGDSSYEKLMKNWKKEKAFSIKTSGYHSYFGLSSSALSNDDEFEVQEDATKAQIKRAFVKSLKNKKMNKKILGEFIELVA